MKLYSKTVGRDIDVETMEKESNGEILTVITHASLENIIYNELGLAKDPECVTYEAENSSANYPSYKCTIWDKERNRCVSKIGSAKPETLTTEIARNYPDEIASNRAFDRAAILYLQFPSKKLSEEEVGIFLPVDFTPSIEIEEPSEIIDDSEVMPIVDAPINSESNEVAEEVVEATIEEPVEEPEEPTPIVETTPASDDLGDYIIDFGKYNSDPTPLKEIVATPDGIEWVKRCMKIKTPAASIKDALDNVRTYCEANGIL